MKFVKIMSLILVVAMMSVCFAACGGNNADNTTASSTTSSTTTSSSTTSSSTTTSSTTTSSTTTSSTTTTTTTPDPDPAEDVVLYENDFETDAGSDNPLNGSQIAAVGGKLSFDNWSAVTWNKSLVLDNETGKVVITFVIYPNLQKDYAIVSINGKAVLSSTNGGIKISGDKLGANMGYNQDSIVRNVTIEIDPATGDCTVTYAHPAGVQWGEVHTETVNVGAVSGTLDIVLGTPVAGRNGFRVDDLKVVQAKAE